MKCLREVPKCLILTQFLQSARLSPLLTWVQFPLGTTYNSYVKRVSQRSTESRGFSPGTPVSSHREC